MIASTELRHMVDFEETKSNLRRRCVTALDSSGGAMMRVSRIFDQITEKATSYGIHMSR